MDRNADRRERLIAREDRRQSVTLAASHALECNRADAPEDKRLTEAWFTNRAARRAAAALERKRAG